MSRSPTYVFFNNICIIPFEFTVLIITYQNIIQNNFLCLLKLILIKKIPWRNSMELYPEFHGTFWTTFEQHLWFHGIPWNLSNKTSSSMEFHGFCPDPKFHEILWNVCHTPEFHGIPWNPMELLIFPKKVPWNSMELEFDMWKNHISK